MALEARRDIRKRSPNAKGNARVNVNERALAFARGELTVDDLDEQELIRGQLRNKHGDFRGRPADMVPREFAQAVIAKQQQMVKGKLAEMVVQALKTIDEVMARKNPQPGDNARVNAAKLVLEYNIGKVPDKVEIKGQIEHWERQIEETGMIEYLTIEEEKKDDETQVAD